MTSGALGPLVAVSLDRTPDRWATFEAANRGVADIERMSAVDGLVLRRDDLVGRGLIHPDLTYSAGALGCALSHAALWRRAVDSGAPLTICEDDAVLRPDLLVAGADAAQARSGFHLILWGWNFNSVLGGRVFGDTPFAIGFDQDRMRGDVAAFRAEQSAPILLRLTRALGTPCYTVSAEGARILLERCFPLSPTSVVLPLVNREASNTGIDIAMNAAYPEMAAFVAFPPLAITPNDPTRSTVG